MRTLKLALFAAGLTLSAMAYADVPVVHAYVEPAPSSPAQMTPPVVTASPDGMDDASTDNLANSTPISDQTTLPMDQRVAVLERQVSNLAQLLPQVNNLQAQIQNLQGQLEIAQHSLQTLQTQLASQYQDLDQRLSRQGALATKAAGGTTSPTDTVAALPATPTKSAVTAPAVDTDADKTAYQAAFSLLQNKKYTESSTAFQKFIKQYPKSTYVSSAYYWLGQLNLLQGQPDAAIKQFQTIINSYAQDKKVPDAMVQLGLAYYAKGDLTNAKLELNAVQKKYPGTDAANLAKTRMQQIIQTK